MRNMNECHVRRRRARGAARGEQRRASFPGEFPVKR